MSKKLPANECYFRLNLLVGTWSHYNNQMTKFRLHLNGKSLYKPVLMGCLPQKRHLLEFGHVNCKPTTRG